MSEHTITPPPELVDQWDAEAGFLEGPDEQYIATQAARWGADQELEACCEWVRYTHTDDMTPDALRAARRPKPPSLKEQALQALASSDGADHPVVATFLTADQHALIRSALEALPE